MTIQKRIKEFLHLASISAAILMISSAALTANPIIVVKLESDDGSVSVEGQLIAMEDGFYVIQTPRDNEVRVQSNLIKCVSAVCPN